MNLVKSYLWHLIVLNRLKCELITLKGGTNENN